MHTVWRNMILFLCMNNYRVYPHIHPRPYARRLTHTHASTHATIPILCAWILCYIYIVKAQAEQNLYAYIRVCPSVYVCVCMCLLAWTIYPRRFLIIIILLAVHLRYDVITWPRNRQNNSIIIIIINISYLEHCRLWNGMALIWYGCHLVCLWYGMAMIWYGCHLVWSGLVCLFVYLSVWLSHCLSPFITLSLSLYIYICVCVRVCVYVCVF